MSVHTNIKTLTKPTGPAAPTDTEIVEWLSTAGWMIDIDNAPERAGGGAVIMFGPHNQRKREFAMSLRLAVIAAMRAEKGSK